MTRNPHRTHYQTALVQKIITRDSHGNEIASGEKLRHFKIESDSSVWVFFTAIMVRIQNPDNPEQLKRLKINLDGKKAKEAIAKDEQDRSRSYSASVNTGALLPQSTDQCSLHYVGKTLQYAQQKLPVEVWVVIASCVSHINTPKDLTTFSNFSLGRTLGARLFCIASVDVSHDILAPLFCGDINTVRHMLNLHPEYVFKKGHGIDLAGHRYQNISPLQAVVATQYDALIPEIEESVRAVDQKTGNGYTIKKIQLIEILTQGIQFFIEKLELDKQFLQSNNGSTVAIDEKVVQQTVLVQAIASQNTETMFNALLKAQEENTFDFSALLTAVNNMDNVDIRFNADNTVTITSVTLRTAVDTFINQYKEHTEKQTITNLFDVLKAKIIYKNNWSFWSRSTNSKCTVFWNFGVGTAQSLTPTNVAQDLCQGLYHTQHESPPEPRASITGDSNLIFRDSSNPPIGFYPSQGISRRRLGVDFGVDDYGRSVWKFLGWTPWFQNLCQTKTPTLASLCVEHKLMPTSRNVVAR